MGERGPLEIRRCLAGVPSARPSRGGTRARPRHGSCFAEEAICLLTCQEGAVVQARFGFTLVVHTQRLLVCHPLRLRAQPEEASGHFGYRTGAVGRRWRAPARRDLPWRANDRERFEAARRDQVQGCSRSRGAPPHEMHPTFFDGQRHLRSMLDLVIRDC